MTKKQLLNNLQPLNNDYVDITESKTKQARLNITPKNNKTSKTIYIDSDIMHEINKLAKKNNTSFNIVINEVLKQWLNN